MKKISYLALITIIIQTIITFGLNWVYFLIYYRLNKYAFISNNIELNNVNSFSLFFQKERKKISTFSLFFYFIYLIIFAFLIMLVNDIDFFMLVHYNLGSYIKSTIIYSILLSVIIFFILLYSYKILIKNVYNAIYQNNHCFFNSYNEYDLTLFFILCLLTGGIFFLIYLFMLAIHELYLFILNKYHNKSKYYFTNFGVLALFLLLLIVLVLIAYLIQYHQYLNNITIYITVVLILNLFLGYGLFELKMRLFLNNDLYILKKSIKYQPHPNKFYVLISLVAILICFTFSIIKINKINDNFYTLEFENITSDNLYCVDYENNSVCRLSAEDFDPFSNKYSRHSIWRSQYIGYNMHRMYIVLHTKASEIINQPIKVNYAGDVLYTTKEGEFFTNNKGAYLYVQTYYKKDGENYIPVFNIIKNLELLISFDYDTLYLSILNNDVYKYDFFDDSLTKYKDNYINIDTTRLMIDDLDINFYSIEENLYGYHIQDNLTELEIKSDDNINKLLLILSYLDPFPIDELLYNLSQSFKPLDEEKLKYISDYDLSLARLFNNTKHISYANDRYFLYMRQLNQKSQSIDHSYRLNEDLDFDVCEVYGCNDVEEKFFTHNINIKYMSNILYSDIFVEATEKFNFYDKKLITIFLDGNRTFSGEIEIKYTIKSIKQYFQKEYIKEDTQIIIN